MINSLSIWWNQITTADGLLAIYGILAIWLVGDFFLFYKTGLGDNKPPLSKLMVVVAFTHIIGLVFSFLGGWSLITYEIITNNTTPITAYWVGIGCIVSSIVVMSLTIHDGKQHNAHFDGSAPQPLRTEHYYRSTIITDLARNKVYALIGINAICALWLVFS